MILNKILQWLLKIQKTKNRNTVIALVPINWTKRLVPIPKVMLKWHKNYCLYTYNLPVVCIPKIFSCCGGVRIRSDELIRNIRNEIFIFRSCVYAIIDQLKFLIKSYQIWLYSKILVLTLIIVPDGYIAGVVYRIYLAKNYFCVLLMVKLLVSTQFLTERETCL